MRDKLQKQFTGANWAQPRRGIPRSGRGSTLAHTESLREALPGLFAKYDVRRFVDAPCGDWHWMQHVDLGSVDYLGLDIVAEIVAANAADHGRPNVRFAVADITSDPLPQADLLMCRDCLFHLKFWLRWEFLANFVASGTPWLLTTAHDNPVNVNVAANGKFQRFNPRVAPFNLPDPVELISDLPVGEEGAARGDGFLDGRHMGLWHRDQIAAVLANRPTT